ncbi:cathepsin B [Halyomorpha halys]|uniref:cathepsin B n=1 Tax=Halyomorpha halys TaxID=286706 RepID=UPI0006D515FC|nr:cathepsin B-like [Halyomorpha halys]
MFLHLIVYFVILKKLGTISLMLTVVATSANVDFDAIIQKVNSVGASWKAGLPTITASSIIGQYCAWKSPSKPTKISLHINSVIPEEFDSRERWPYCPTIRSIRNQGKCGSCWAVAAASTLSDRLCIATNGSFTLPLSENEIISCCKECGSGCHGGFHDKAWQYLVTHGIVTGGGYLSHVGCQPYEIPPCERVPSNSSRPNCQSLPVPQTPQCRTTCTNSFYNVSYSSDHRRLLNQYQLPNNTLEIQKEILTNGPVEAAISVYSDFLTYHSGIYHHLTTKEVSRHAVKIIGWGSEGDVPFWLVANTFDTDWGEGGFFRILRGSNECGIEDDVTGGTPLV